MQCMQRNECTTGGRAQVLALARTRWPSHACTASHWIRTHWPAPKLSFFAKKNRRTWLSRHHTRKRRLMQMCIVQNAKMCERWGQLSHNANLSSLLRLEIGMPAVLLHNHDLSNSSKYITGPELPIDTTPAAKHHNHLQCVQSVCQ